TVTTTTLATATASGTAAPTTIVCPNPNPQCINNSTILCDTSGEGVENVSSGDVMTLLGCMRQGEPHQGTFVGSGQAAGNCACWEGDHGPWGEVPYVGSVSFIPNSC